eukprot:TRINITY_DN36778_c0_g1_i1.p1 TRINITY_DN36778_c0_g1~~TRINITY_DN36778_c0_g1_i1.p1  ORF type:complete len:1020 (+),score=212.99 TRINITY_DN36778_c0_g1_i1:182-3241(+)
MSAQTTAARPAAGDRHSLDPAAMRILEGTRSAPYTPERTRHSPADTPEPNLDIDKMRVTLADILSISQDTLQEYNSVEEMSKQMVGAQISGAVFQALEISQPRERAIRWLTSQFEKYGFRDEWLSVAVSYMDRIVGRIVEENSNSNSTSTGTGIEGSPLEGTPGARSLAASRRVNPESLRKVAKLSQSKELWLTAVQLALKMSEAEPELDSSIRDLVIAMADGEGLKCDVRRWRQVISGEFFMMNHLEYRLNVPTAFQLVDRIGLLLNLAAQKAPSGGWPGTLQGHLPQLRGPPLRNKAQEEVRLKLALPARPIMRYQALALFLVELVVVHRPADVYGEKAPLQTVAFAALHLAMHGFQGVAPAACTTLLDDLEKRLLSPEHLAAKSRILNTIHNLWLRLPEGSPVVAKWRGRSLNLGGLLPSAPKQLPASLLVANDAFSTPQRRPPAATPGSLITPCRPMLPASQDASMVAAEAANRFLDRDVEKQPVADEPAAVAAEEASRLSPSDKKVAVTDDSPTPQTSPPSTDLDTPSSSQDSAAVKDDGDVASGATAFTAVTTNETGAATARPNAPIDDPSAVLERREEEHATGRAKSAFRSQKGNTQEIDKGFRKYVFGTPTPSPDTPETSTPEAGNQIAALTKPTATPPSMRSERDDLESIFGKTPKPEAELDPPEESFLQEVYRESMFQEAEKETEVAVEAVGVAPSSLQDDVLAATSAVKDKEAGARKACETLPSKPVKPLPSGVKLVSSQAPASTNQMPARRALGCRVAAASSDLATPLPAPVASSSSSVAPQAAKEDSPTQCVMKFALNATPMVEPAQPNVEPGTGISAVAKTGAQLANHTNKRPPAGPFRRYHIQPVGDAPCNGTRKRKAMQQSEAAGVNTLTSAASAPNAPVKRSLPSEPRHAKERSSSRGKKFRGPTSSTAMLVTGAGFGDCVMSAVGPQAQGEALCAWPPKQDVVPARSEPRAQETLVPLGSWHAGPSMQSFAVDKTAAKKARYPAPKYELRSSSLSQGQDSN